MEASLSKRSYAFVNHQQVSLVVVPTVFTTLAVAFTALRIYSRRLKKAKVLVDDYLCIAACILSLALLGGNIAMVVAGGGGNSVASLKDPNDLTIWLKLLITTYLIWCATIAVVQFAILFLYRRLFFIFDWFRYTCYIVMAIVFAWFIAAWASDLAICNPTKKLWEPMTPGRCADGKKMCSIIGIIHAVLDFTILMIPMPLIWKLQTSTLNKAFISALLLCGVFATICAILRLECLINLSHYNSMDLPNYMWLSLIYHFIEAPVAVCCCCMPALPPVVEKVKMTPLGSYARSLFSKSWISMPGSKKSTSQESKNSDNSNFGKLGGGSSGAVSQEKPSDEVQLNTHSIGVQHAFNVDYDEHRRL